MRFTVEPTIDILAQLVRQEGTLHKGGSAAGRDCYELTTGMGMYSVPSYEGPWAPCDFPDFKPGPAGGRAARGPFGVLEVANADPEIQERLKAANLLLVTPENISMDQLEQLIRHHGELRKAGNPAGRDCYALVTASGTYMVKTYEGMAAPCDFQCFMPGSSSRYVGGEDAVLENARADADIAKLIVAAAEG